MDVSISMIVKNEIDFLAGCLDSISAFASEIVIVDTGSSDGTREIARRYTDKVFDYEWTDDFSAARNYCLSLASNDWVLILDADERLESYEQKSLNELFKRPEALGRVKLINEYGDGAGIRASGSRLSRVFNKNYYRFNGIIHEQLERNDGRPKSFYDVDLVLLHHGYSWSVTQSKEKSIRNRTLLERALKSAPGDAYLYFQLGRTYVSSKEKDYKKASELFERAVKLGECPENEYFFELIHSYGYSLINDGQYGKAMELLKYMDVYGNRADYVFMTAHIYMNNAMLDKAIGSFRRCLSMGEGQAEGITSYLAHFNIGVILECTGNIQMAIKSYRACGDYPPARERLRLISG